jgi:serine/threonine protein kinase
MEPVVGGQSRLQRLIGAGSFGEVYSAEHTRTYHRVAIKLEKLHCSVPQLQWESKLYALLAGGVGIPRLHWCGATKIHNAIVIALLGKSLEELFVSRAITFLSKPCSCLPIKCWPVLNGCILKSFSTVTSNRRIL